MIASVILPVYNEEKYIRRCLDSLLVQSQKGLEIIVIDDGSIDNTRRLVGEYAHTHTHVRLITQEHGGPGAARNKGAHTAKGKVLLFLDADMYFAPTFVEKLVQPILDGKAVGTTGGWQELGNPESLIARMRYNEMVKARDKRVATGTQSPTSVFRAIDKQFFLNAEGFNTSSDYFDDNSIAEKTGKKPMPVEAPGWYHNYAQTLEEVFADSTWGARSRMKFAGPASTGSYYLSGLILFLLVQPTLFLFFWPWILLAYALPLVILGVKGVLEFGDMRAAYLYPLFLLSRFAGVCNGVLQYFVLPHKKGK